MTAKLLLAFIAVFWVGVIFGMLTAEEEGAIILPAVLTGIVILALALRGAGVL